jgi:ornithine--oxo-acid transaminase
MSLAIVDLFAEREAERHSLHARHLNEQMVRVLKTIGFDRGTGEGRGNTSMTGTASDTSTC